MKPPPDPRPDTQAPSPPKLERRRPGRPETVSAELIPLLRGETSIPDQPLDPISTAEEDRKRLQTGEGALFVAWLAFLLLMLFVALGGWSWLFGH